jgi:hypothetical protein
MRASARACAFALARSRSLVRASKGVGGVIDFPIFFWGGKMSNRLLFSAAVIAILANAGAISSAQAADDAFCKDYARTAVNQFRAAASHDRCDVHRRDAGRWQADWRAHYDWCRGVNRDTAWAERNARKRALEQCTRRQ